MTIITPTVTLIVAAADNGVIGRDNALPWHLPEDLKRFKRLTLGKPIVMGRKTYESIGKPLPGRTNIVLTRDSNYRREGVVVAHDVDAVLAAAARAPDAGAEVMVIGGADVFRLFLPRARRLQLTRVHADVAGDIRLPDLGPGWRVVQSETLAADERHQYPMTFETLERDAQPG